MVQLNFTPDIEVYIHAHAYLCLLADQSVDGALIVVARHGRGRAEAVLAKVTGRAILAALLVHLPVLSFHLKP